MLDNLPLHIRETIFSRVRYIDLFETARVSQQWWTLTMASFERFHHKKDDFLLDQVDFCNEMMPKEEPWEWWMLIEFTISKRLFLEISDFHALVSEGEGRLIQYFSSKQIHVKHLRVVKNESPSNNELLKLPSNLDEIFPCLTSLEVDRVAQDNEATLFLPSLISLRFGFARLPFSFRIDMNTSGLKVLDLKAYGFFPFHLPGAQEFGNLTRLSVSTHSLPPSSSSQFESSLKSVLLENKKLKSVSIHNAYITKEWLKIFSSNVVKIKLFKPHLNKNLVKAFGKKVFYERLLLLYVCEDWRSVVKFKTCSMSWDKYQEEVVDDEAVVNDEENDDAEEEVDDDEGNNEGGDDYGIENAYQVDYTCKPTANKEKIFVKYRKVAINELISKNNQDLLLTTLMYYKHSYQNPIPPNVRYLSVIQDWNRPKYDDFEIVLEDPTALQNLIVYHMDRMSTLPNMINLKELEVFECDEYLLISILRSCTSLSKLTLTYPKPAVFRKISSKVKSVSLKGLTIIGSIDTFEDILEHFPSLKSLTLEKHSREAILKSDVNAIKRLEYFKVIMQGNKKVAVHLSNLQFPYVLFLRYRNSHHYAASKGMELLNEISRNTTSNNMVEARRSFVLHTKSCIVSHNRVSLVYAKNIATRFMRNTCPLVSTVQDFIDKL